MAGEYNTNVYMEQGGDALVVGSSGSLKFGTVAQTGCVRGGSYTAVAGDATAGEVDIVTGLTSVDTFQVQILRAGVPISSDQVITESGGTITVADGASTYDVTAGDVFNWTAVGT